MSGTFISGMLGIEGKGDPIDGAVVFGSIAVIIITFITFITMNYKVTWVSKYSVLLSIGLGWLIFLLLGKTTSFSSHSERLIELPKLLVYGKPIWDSGMFVTAVFITLLLIANMMASIRVKRPIKKTSD
ncbi:xanthine/uracil permease [Filibacter limicola]|uniref:Xanthine/uracil permease n=1 Tax=Sporosarcina limicola TaxID=34101 RepID=A0A927MKD8_9BACL|nr:purine/pyrimidine permease [Sporosarcina limicola]MBE1555985.1 xanthine/uracil permease [Sporosarcina limicola]